MLILPLRTPATPCLSIMQSQSLSYPLGQLPLSKVPHVHQALFREVDVLHRRHVLGGWLADTRGDDDGVRLEDDAVVDELVDGERLRDGQRGPWMAVVHTYHEVVVLNDGALVDRVPVSLSVWVLDGRVTVLT